MATRLLSPCDIEPLHRLFNAVTAPLAHAFPATPGEFHTAMTASAPHLREVCTLVAERNGETLGFLRAGRFGPYTERWTLATEGEGMLFGPFVLPGHVSEGTALLAAGIAHLRSLDARTALAFDPVEGVSFPFFNGGWAGLSERLPHIAGLLCAAGFRIRHRELCLTRPDRDALPVPALPVGFAFQHETRDRSRFALHAYESRRCAGTCRFSRMYPTHSGERAAERFGYIDGLGVEEPWRGRGLGRALMCEALARLRELGCGPVFLTTGDDNYRAQNLYYSLGFAVVDSCITLEARL